MSYTNKNKYERTPEHGSALIYILVAIALLAALTITFMEPASQQTSSQNTFKAVSLLKRQADYIQSSLQECVINYPEGDGEITDDDASFIYPINPSSSYLTDPADNRDVRNIRCPGNKEDASDDSSHAKIFGGSNGKFLPPPPDLFDEWQYYSGVDGVFFWISSSKSDAFIQSALEKLDENFAECEADIINSTGGSDDLDSNGDVECASGNMCFRVRVLTNSDTAVYPDGCSS